jgi:SAM-dependent methyltransferase
MTPRFSKHEAYSLAVQSPAYDVRFLRKVYREVRGAEPAILREDFCGTFALCCEWVKLGADKSAIGLDIDLDPLEYGKEHYLPELSPSQRNRVTPLERNVLSPTPQKVDLACALNFSYFAFHDRPTLLRYFTSARKTLRKNGVFIVDIFGGPDYGSSFVDKKKLPEFTYEFEQEFFDPISNTTRFRIHFTPHGKRRIKNAFTYNWRLWSIPEVREIMGEAGFKNCVVYWEGTARNGRGSGEFHRRERGESCRIWVAYVVGIL